MVRDGRRRRYERDDEKPPRVLLLLRSLNHGGAERQVVTLARALKAEDWPVAVACFYAGGPLQCDLEHAGVSVIDLGKRGRWDVAPFLRRLVWVLRQERPDVVYGFLPAPNLVAILAKVFCPRVRVVWGVRSSNIDHSQYDWLSRLSYWLDRRFARWADLVIANSVAGAKLRVASGFPERTMRVIPNGVDTERFRFDAEGRTRLRREWHVPDHATLVGLVGRLDPMKDHATFIATAARLAARESHWYFVCVGDGPAAYKTTLAALPDASELAQRLIWAGARDDMPAVYSALDIVASSSSGEGFANVIAEAMACGRPCVVTGVGDSAMIVGDLGIVVPPHNSAALAGGVERMYQRLQEAENGIALAAACRARVVSEFSVATLVRRTGEALLAVSAAKTAGKISLVP